jgi:hypothetical protein
MPRNSRRGPIAVLAIGWKPVNHSSFCSVRLAAVAGGAGTAVDFNDRDIDDAGARTNSRRTQEAQSQQPIPVTDATQRRRHRAGSSGSSHGSIKRITGSQQLDLRISWRRRRHCPSAETEDAHTISPASKPKTVKTVSAAKTYDNEPTADGDYTIAEQTVAYGGAIRTTAVWGQGFLGYDRHSNLAPGNQENPTRTATTAGGLLGADWTHITRDNGVRAVQYGMFSGYSDTHARRSDTFFFTDEIDANGNDGQDGVNDTNYFRSNNKEEIEGPFVGAYLAYVQDA